MIPTVEAVSVMVVVIGVTAWLFKVFEIVGVIGWRACGEEKIVSWTTTTTGRSVMVVFIAACGFEKRFIVGVGVETGVRCVVGCSWLRGGGEKMLSGHFKFRVLVFKSLGRVDGLGTGEICAGEGRRGFHI